MAIIAIGNLVGHRCDDSCRLSGMRRSEAGKSSRRHSTGKDAPAWIDVLHVPIQVAPLRLATIAADFDFPERGDEDQDVQESEVETYATHNAETRDAFRPIERAGLRDVQVKPTCRRHPRGVEAKLDVSEPGSDLPTR